MGKVGGKDTQVAFPCMAPNNPESNGQHENDIEIHRAYMAVMEGCWVYLVGIT